MNRFDTMLLEVAYEQTQQPDEAQRYYNSLEALVVSDVQYNEDIDYGEEVVRDPSNYEYGIRHVSTGKYYIKNLSLKLRGNLYIPTLIPPELVKQKIEKDVADDTLDVVYRILADREMVDVTGTNVWDKKQSYKVIELSPTGQPNEFSVVIDVKIECNTTNDE